MASWPVLPMLAAAVSELPTAWALPGGCWYEPKFDGYRALARVDGGVAEVRSRRGTDLTALFPEIAGAAAEQLPGGVIVDGELLIWSGGRPDFGALQRGMIRRKDTARLVQSEPGSLLLFDVLHAGTDSRGSDSGAGSLMGVSLRERRRVLNQLGQQLSPPLQVVPGTDDIAVARG